MATIAATFCVDKRNYNLVFGFLNEAHQLLPSNTIYFSIPQQIYYICLAYFEADCFAECGPNMKISTTKDNTTVVTYASDDYSWNTCFGALRIESMSDTIHCWKFKVLACSLAIGNMCIGIDGGDVTESTRNGYGFHFKTKKAYGLKCTGNRFSGNTEKYQNVAGNNGAVFKAGDCVTMELDLLNRTLSYDINKKTQDKFENIKKKKNLRYRMAVTTFYTTDSICLLEYRNKYNKFVR